MKKVSCDTLIFCSSPNNRGIHQYALDMGRIMRDSTLVTPKERSSFILWEIAGILFYYKKMLFAKRVIFANTRITPLLWPFLPRKRMVVVVHDLMDTIFEKDCKAKREGLGKVLKRWVNTWLIVGSIRKAGLVIANSETTRFQLEKHKLIRSSGVVVVRPGPSFGSEEINSYFCLCEEEGVRSRTLNVFTITGKTDNKRSDDYFRLLDMLLVDEGIDAKLVLVGLDIGDLSSNSRSVYDRHRTQVEIRKTVEKETLLEYYLSCDVYVALSAEEGYGIPVADAAGFGIPVIARDIPSFREISTLKEWGNKILICRNAIECSELIVNNYRGWKYIRNSVGTELKEKRLANYKDYRRYCEEAVYNQLGMTWGDWEKK